VRSLALICPVVELISSSFVHQHDEEYKRVKAERRPGRPASTREDVLKLKIQNAEKEWETGFYMPDLTAEENAVFLDRWDGTWSYLPSIKWVFVKKDGTSRPAVFPPKGEH
jgi:translation machinery-associated protein 16